MMFKKTVSFFSKAIFENRANTARIVLGTVIDTIASTSNTIAPLLVVDAVKRGEEAPIYYYYLLGSSVILARLLPKIRSMLVTPVMTNVQKKLTLEMLEKTYSLELDRHLSAPTGQFAEALSRNYTTVQSMIPVVFGDIIPFVIDTVVITLALGIKEYEIGAFPPGILAAFLSIAALAEKQLAKTRNNRSNVYNQAFGMLMQAIGNYSVAHQFGNTNYELQRVRPIMDRAEALNRRTFLISNGVGLLQTLVNYLGLAGAFLLGAYKHSQGYLTTADLAFISYVMTTFSMRLDTITPALSTLHASYTDARKIIEFSERQSVVADLGGATDLKLNSAPVIKFKNVTFRYPAPGGGISAPVLNGVSFTVNAGETLAIVGKTGAGKSTILQLLLRFYHCSGRILINDADISSFTQASLRDHITIVTQEAGLFNAKVLDNIQYGNLRASDDEIKEIAKVAEYLKQDESVEKLNAEVGEKGQKLSGGERQRVAIARALLKGGLILLLDEPTSSVDAETAEDVLNKLNEIKQGATTIIVTHKLYELINVDKILYIEKGNIVEQGNFKELLSKKGKFATQLEAQCRKLNISLEDIQAKLRMQEKEEQEPKPVRLRSNMTVVSNFWKRKNPRPQDILLNLELEGDENKRLLQVN